MRRTKRLVLLALFTAIALTVFLIEAQIPPLIPVAGVKLGLANIVTLVTLCLFGGRDALLVLLTRCLLGALLAGQPTALLYSLTGGLLSLLVTLLLRRLFRENQLFILSALGGMTHNLGQLAAAILVTGTPELLFYLPVLLLSGMLAGLFTGFAAQTVLHRFRKTAGSLPLSSRRSDPSERSPDSDTARPGKPSD